jgi:hypothetical protein
MIRWRRAAAWLGVVAQLVGIHSLGAQSTTSITIAISGIRGDSIPPAPNIDVTALNPQPGLTYAITLELSTEPAFARPFFVQAAPGLTARFHLDSLLTEFTPIYFRARLIPLGGITAVTEKVEAHPVLAWLRLVSPPQQPLYIDTTRRPKFVWSSPPITLLWQYDLTIVSTATGVAQFLFTPLTDTSFTPDSLHALEANTSYSWRVTAHALNSTGSTEVTVSSAGTFAIQSPTQPTVTLFYQNFPNPFGRGERQDQTCFWFDLDRAATVRLTIFDIRLRRVRQIVPGPIGNGVMNAGSFGRSAIDAKSGCDPALTWDGKDDRGQFVPPGIYIAQFVANGKSTTVKMMYKGPP